MVTDSSAVIVSRHDYMPFGEEIGATAARASLWGVTGDLNQKFTGKQRDTESGLDYFGARYYASNMGRFMSADWAAKPEAVPYSVLGDPQSLNLYSYVRNNPLSKADPDGNCDWCKQFTQWVSTHVASVGIGIQNTRNSYNAAASAAPLKAGAGSLPAGEGGGLVGAWEAE